MTRTTIRLIATQPNHIDQTDITCKQIDEEGGCWRVQALSRGVAIAQGKQCLEEHLTKQFLAVRMCDKRDKWKTLKRGYLRADNLMYGRSEATKR